MNTNLQIGFCLGIVNEKREDQDLCFESNWTLSSSFDGLVCKMLKIDYSWVDGGGGLDIPHPSLEI